jgi:hypothetical protein
MERESSPRGVAGSSGTYAKGEITPADWQMVMEGVLHPNDDQGDQNLIAAINTFRDTGKLPAFKQRIDHLRNLIDQAES